MKNPEWPGNAGADHWNVYVGHSTNFGNPGVDDLQVPALINVCYARSAASYCNSERSEESRIISLEGSVKPISQRCFAEPVLSEAEGLNMTATCEALQSALVALDVWLGQGR